MSDIDYLLPDQYIYSEYFIDYYQKRLLISYYYIKLSTNYY